MPRSLATSVREELSSIITDSTPGLYLRKPKCLAGSKEGGLLPAENDAGSGAQMSTLSVTEDNSRLNTHRRPGPLDKLQSYRRFRSRSQQNTDGDISASFNKDSVLGGQGVVQSGSANEAQYALVARLPKEIMEYIAELEEQNRQLRQEVVELHGQLHDEQRHQDVVGRPYRELADAFLGNSRTVIASGAAGSSCHNVSNRFPIASDIAFSQEERERYINDILAQVDILVQAHRNQSEAMILRYKNEADCAKSALKQLREAIELEGVDLSMLPVVLATMTSGRAQATCSGNEFFDTCGEAAKTTPSTASKQTGFDVAVGGIEKVINEKCATLVSEAVDVVLGDLLRVEAGDDVPAVVRESVRRSFSALARHLAIVVANCIGHCTEEVRYVQKEREVACRELREEVSVSESQRLRMARRYEAEIRALRDELHAFHVAAANGDGLKAAVHERAIKECSALLVESRKEADSLREKLEEERSANATTCLRLKASLQRRNSEFEAATLRRAEEFVKQRDQRIAGLQQQIDTMHKEEAQRTCGRVSRGVQVQVEANALTESSYITNLLSLPSKRKDHSPASSQRIATPRNSVCNSLAPQLPQSAQCDSGLYPKPENSFEAEVWTKTMELLSKYSKVSPN